MDRGESGTPGGQQRQEQEGSQETEVCESLSMCGAEAGIRTPMSIRSLRPECAGCMAEPRVIFAFRVVNSMTSFAEVLYNEQW